METIKLELAELQWKSKEEQMCKIAEEFNEVIESFIKKDDVGLKSELMDLIQSSFTMLNAISDNVTSENEKHLAKMQKYLQFGRVEKKRERSMLE